MQVIGRSDGRSVIAAAAYRAGQRLVDRSSGRAADFERRMGVVHAEIISPEGSASWLTDREALWNAVERMEARKDAQLAREVNFALPHELSDADRLQLVRGFVSQEFVALGMVADVAIHRPIPEKGDDPRNHHAHVLLTLRQATPSGLRPIKTREWNSDGLLRRWREAWAEHQNRFLQGRSAGARLVDHRSLAVQREEARRREDKVAVVALDRQPEFHVGPRARAAAQRGHVATRKMSGAIASGPGRDVNPLSSRGGRLRCQYDEGRRFDANMGRVKSDLQRLDRLLVRYQARAARVRAARQMLTRQAFEQRTSPLRRLARGSGKLRSPAWVALLLRKLEWLVSNLFRLRDLRIQRYLGLGRVLSFRHRRIAVRTTTRARSRRRQRR